jgi:D-3-phosphoglycerate dehydrogenase
MDELVQHLPDADGIIAGQQIFDREVLKHAKKLKVISVYGVGYDKIDLAAAKEEGALVTNTPGANHDSVSDLAIALMLTAARRIAHMDALVRAGTTTRLIGREMCHKTLGVVGTGRVGKGVIKRGAAGFDMKVLCYDKCPDDAFAAKYNGRYVDMDTLLRGSDFISLHSPLTEETRNMISEAEFKKMKSNAIIVNTARGGIIDENALYDALRTGEIAGAGLDVTVGFMRDSPLRQLPNCILVPHAGASTVEALHNMATMSVDNLVEVLETGKCKYAVN